MDSAVRDSDLIEALIWTLNTELKKKAIATDITAFMPIIGER